MRAYNILHILQVLPILLSVQVPYPFTSSSCLELLSYTASWMPQAGMPQAESRAASSPRPQRGGLIGDRRGGACGEAAPEAGPGSPAPRPARPNPLVC